MLFQLPSQSCVSFFFFFCFTSHNSVWFFILFYFGSWLYCLFCVPVLSFVLAHISAKFRASLLLLCTASDPLLSVLALSRHAVFTHKPICTSAFTTHCIWHALTCTSTSTMCSICPRLHQWPATTPLPSATGIPNHLTSPYISFTSPFLSTNLLCTRNCCLGTESSLSSWPMCQGSMMSFVTFSICVFLYTWIVYPSFIHM